MSVVMIAGCLLFVPAVTEAAFQDQSEALGIPTDPFDLGVDFPFKAAWGDYNNDGWTDLYISRPDLFQGRLLRNEAGASFTNLAEEPGAYSASDPGGVWGDYNNDGFLDLFCSGEHEGEWSLWRNSFGSFANASVGLISLSPWPVRAQDVASCWLDFENDGDLDIYSTGFEVNLDPLPSTPLQDYLLTNNTSAAFTETAVALTGHSRGVTACDYDQDGDMDIYVSVYRQLPNLLWNNDGNGNFTDVAVAAGVAGDVVPVSPALNAYGHSIGSAWGDLDNDGDFDLVVANLNHHDSRWSDDTKFYSNNGDGTFTDVSATVNLTWQESYGSPALADYDNDGDLDIFITTIYGSPDYPVLYQNNGNWSFSDITASEGLANLDSSYQAAWADFDNDGDVDLMTDGKLFVSDVIDPNEPNSNYHWLEVQLEGNGDTINHAAIGAQARITLPGGDILTRQVEGGTGQGNQNDLTLHFGLGTHSAPVDVAITWPNGITQTEAAVSVDQFITVNAQPCPQGDTDGDCDVDMDDLTNLATDWLIDGTSP
jgi:hypothetical protein